MTDSTHDLTILIVEDNKMFRELAYQVFDGYRRVTAEDAADGIEKFKSQCPDITFLDIGLPDKSGLDVLTECMRHDPEAFVVMLTSSRMSGDVALAKERGAAGYITKPFTFAKVQESIVLYHEFKEKLKALSPEERAHHLIRELHVEISPEDVQQDNRSLLQQKLEAEIKQWRILFVDDNAVNRERAQGNLQQRGCIVDIAKSGEDAVEKFGKHTYNLIFMDSHMPGISGYQAADLIRAKDKSCIIIAMIEYSDEFQERLWKEHHMNSFVTKPTKFSELNEMVDQYIIADIHKKSTGSA